MIQQSKINSFIKSISDVAANKKTQIDEQTEEILRAELEQMEASAISEAKEYIRTKSAAIKLETGRRISESTAQCRKEVFSSRSEIAEKVLSAAAEKLKKFTETEEYKSLVMNSAKKILEEFGEGHITLLLRPEDLRFEKDLRAEHSNISVAADETIKIGGVKGINSTVTLLVDDTLDSRLVSRKKWFEENSGLYISMR